MPSICSSNQEWIFRSRFPTEVLVLAAFKGNTIPETFEIKDGRMPFFPKLPLPEVQICLGCSEQNPSFFWFLLRLLRRFLFDLNSEILSQFNLRDIHKPWPVSKALLQIQILKSMSIVGWSSTGNLCSSMIWKWCCLRRCRSPLEWSSPRWNAAD